MYDGKMSVNEQDALMGLVSMVTGGAIGDVPNVANVPYGLVGLRVTATTDLTAYATPGSNNSFLLLTPNNPMDPLDATQVLFPVTALGDLTGSAYTTTGPLWTIANIGSLPLAAVIPRDYRIEDNFETGFKACSEASVVITTLQAGNVALTGTIMSAVVPSPVPRISLTKAGIMANVGESRDMTVSAIDSSHTVIGSGDGSVHSFAGNAVDTADSYQFSRQLVFGPLGAVATGGLVAWANEAGGIPDYMSSPINIEATISPTVAAASIPTGTTLYTEFTINCDFMNVNAAGVVVLNTVQIQERAYVSGPSALSVRPTCSINARVRNPTKPLGYVSYLMGVSFTFAVVNTSVFSLVATTGSTLDVSFTMPNQGVSARAGMQIVCLQNYAGPFTLVNNQHWLARPNYQRQADYRNQMRAPYPTYLKDAINDAVYTMLGASMGRCFSSRQAFEAFVDQMGKPEVVYSGLSDPTPGSIPLTYRPEHEAESMHSAREPLLRAARYRGDAGLSTSTYHAALWPMLAQAGRWAWKKFMPSLAPIMAGEVAKLGNLFSDSSSFQSARYGATSFPTVGQSSFHAAGYEGNVGCDCKCNLPADGHVTGSDSDFDTLVSDPEVHYHIRHHVAEQRQNVYEDFERPEEPLWEEFLTRSKYLENLSVQQRSRIAANHMAGIGPFKSCLTGACPKPCCSVDTPSPHVLRSPAKPTYHCASEGEPAGQRVLFKPVGARLCAYPVVRDYDHREKIGEVLHAAGYRPNTQSAKVVLASVGFPCAGPLKSSSDDMDFDSLLSTPSPSFEMDDDDSKGAAIGEDLGDLEDGGYDDDEPDPDVAQAVSSLEKRVRVKPNTDASLSHPQVNEYGKLSEAQMKKMTIPVVNGYYYDVLATGAGPIVSSHPASRIAGLRKSPTANNEITSAANFPLVGKDGVYIGTIFVTDLPVQRTYEKMPAHDAHLALSESLRMSYRIGAVKKSRVVAGKVVYNQFHVGNEFNENTVAAISGVVDIFFAMSNPPVHNRYISVVVEERVLSPQDIDGNSFSVALLCALLGLPCGPAMTGGLGSDGRITKVGKLAEKVEVFYGQSGQLFGPLLIPTGQLLFEKAANFELMCNLQSWIYIFHTNVMEITSVRDLLGFFSGGGYEQWLKRMDPEGAKVATMDIVYKGVIAAGQLKSVVNSLQQTTDAVTAIKTSGEPKSVVTSKLAELQAKFTLLNTKKTELMGLMIRTYEYEKKENPGSLPSSKNSAIASQANTALQKYNAGSSGMFGKFKSGETTGQLTKIQNRSALFGANAPAVLVGTAAPANKAQMSWMSEWLEGGWLNAGDPSAVKDWWYIPKLYERKSTVADFTFESLFTDGAKKKTAGVPAAETKKDPSSSSPPKSGVDETKSFNYDKYTVGQRKAHREKFPSEYIPSKKMPLWYVRSEDRDASKQTPKE